MNTINDLLVAFGGGYKATYLLHVHRTGFYVFNRSTGRGFFKVKGVRKLKVEQRRRFSQMDGGNHISDLFGASDCRLSP